MLAVEIINKNSLKKKFSDKSMSKVAQKLFKSNFTDFNHNKIPLEMESNKNYFLDIIESDDNDESITDSHAAIDFLNKASNLNQQQLSSHLIQSGITLSSKDQFIKNLEHQNRYKQLVDNKTLS